MELNGFDNEFLFVKALNNHKICELNPLLAEVLYDLFPREDDSSIIKCWLNHYRQKSDIMIKVNGKIKGISIKMGMKNSVHLEHINCFVRFLTENKVDKDIINMYLMYHYADGTTNGTGITRLSVNEYKKKNSNEIKKINKVFNDTLLLKKAIKRFVSQGNNSNYSISGIIWGVVDDFLWINTDDIINLILSNKNEESSAVHFGPLICQPKTRCLNYNQKYEDDRHYVQIKWYTLFDNILDNMNRKQVDNVEET